MKNHKRIVLTGAESTGKSTLAQGLSSHYNSIWIPEFAREYVEKLGHHYTFEDVETIARKQINTELELKTNAPFIFFDTWLIITKVWFDFVYGKHPEWLHEAILNSKIDLFLVCDIDMLWVADPVRENGGDNRQILHDIYINELKKYNFDFVIISGQGDKRLVNAINEINKII